MCKLGESKEIDQYTNDPLDLPVKKKEYGEREYWFVDGTDYGSKAAFDARLLEKASEKCEADREKARQSGFVGKWGPKEGPGVCAEESYICDGKIVDEFDYFRTCGIVPPAQCKRTLYEEDQECVDYELNDYSFKKCGSRPRPGSPDNCRDVGMGKPEASRNGWDKTKACGEWAKCMKLY